MCALRSNSDRYFEELSEMVNAREGPPTTVLLGPGAAAPVAPSIFRPVCPTEVMFQIRLCPNYGPRERSNFYQEAIPCTSPVSP